VQLDRVEVRVKGRLKFRRKKRVRKRSIIINPSTCTPASTTLEVAFHNPAQPKLTALSSYTPTGC
jgi:hypothetical protein